MLDRLDCYLDELVVKHANYTKVEALKRDNTDIDIPLPDYTEKTWRKLGQTGLLPAVRTKSLSAPGLTGWAILGLDQTNLL